MYYYTYMNDTLLSIKRAADLMGISTHTLRRWDKEEKFKPTMRTPVGDRLYSLDSVREYMKEHYGKIK